MQKITKISFTLLIGLTGVSIIAFSQGDLLQGKLSRFSSYDETSCYDTDGGLNFEKKGTTYGKMANIRRSQTQFTDSCNGTILTEYSCEGTNVKSNQEECESGCANGACNSVSTTCKYHPGGQLSLNQSGNYAFNEDSEYEIKLVAIQKETFKGQINYVAKLTVNGIQTNSVQMYDKIKVSDIFLKITNIENDKVYFSLYKDCTINTDSSLYRDIPLGYSELNCQEYTGPGTYDVKACDRIKASSSSKVTAYINDVDPTHIALQYMITTNDGSFLSPLPHSSLSGDTSNIEDFGNGFFGLNLYVDNLSYSVNNKTASLKVLNSCTPIFEKCMNNFNNIHACASLCPYESTDGYYIANLENTFFSKIPTSYNAALAECQTLRIKNATAKETSFIGFNYPFPTASLVHILENPYVSTAMRATGWGYISTPAMSAYYQDACLNSPQAYALAYTTADHESNHNYFMGSAMKNLYGQYPSIEEGLVNYIANIGLPEYEQDAPLNCQENGYILNGKLQTYGPKDTFSGQCFWQEIDTTYGHETFIKIMKEINQSRYIDPKAGRKKSILLFKDIINPIIGSNELEKRANKWFGYTEDY